MISLREKTRERQDCQLLVQGRGTSHSTSFLQDEIKKKGQPGAEVPACARSGEGSDPLGVYCTQPFPAFLQEAISTT